jgi:hypothetical protein
MGNVRRLFSKITVLRFPREEGLKNMMLDIWASKLSDKVLPARLQTLKQVQGDF